MSPHQIRILKLNNRDFKQGELFRLDRNWTLRFVLGPSLMGHKVRVFTNLPSEKEKAFNRREFYELSWNPGSLNKGDDLDMFSEIVCNRAGAFDYFFLVDNNDPKCQSGSGFFQVAPTITVGQDDTVLNLDSIQGCTHISKLLGPLPTWLDRLRVAKEAGYNMIHFTPVQELGDSNSAYSIADQMVLNPNFSDGTTKFDMPDLRKLTEKMRREWQVMSVCDVVLNHTAANTKWIQEHPDASYNLVNSTHLRPAYVLDRVLAQFTRDVLNGKYEKRGIPINVNNQHHLEAIRAALLDEVFPHAALHEFFQLDVHQIADNFAKRMESSGKSQTCIGKESDMKLIQDEKYCRFGCTIDIEMALGIFNCNQDNCRGEIERRQRVLSQFRHAINQLNNQAAATCWEHLCSAVNAILGHISYERVDPQGPLIESYSVKHPLLPKYFTQPTEDSTWEKEQDLMFGDKAHHIMAFNGWVMTDDPLKNFAEPPSMVYFRRELIAWGDCIKLRYGEKPEDSAYLWNRMRDYTSLTANVFQGIRLDNCHSTPIHVAQYLLDEARKTNPNLYVIAELFTGSEHLDNIFVNNLGISSLIREAQSAPDPHEQGRLVYRYGGEPVGAFLQRNMRPMAPSIAHALFFDLTHDNPCPVQTRTIYDLLPTAALVSMACCATGSSRGYDELLNYHVHVVSEERLYSSWSDSTCEQSKGQVNENSGIIKARAVFNELHREMGAHAFKQVFVDQIESDVVAVTRHNSGTHQSIIMVARLCFTPHDLHVIKPIAPLKIEGRIEEIIVEANVKKCGDWVESANGRPKPLPPSKRVNGHENYILGPTGYKLNIATNIPVVTSSMVDAVTDGDIQTDVDFTNFPPGSVIVFRVSMRPQSRSGVLEMRRELLNHHGYQPRTLSGKGLIALDTKGLPDILNEMSLSDLNRVLFRCHEEEEDEGKGGGAYNVPQLGRLVYCGIQGVFPIMNQVRVVNDLGHPICNNLRSGDWLAQYYVNRLKAHATTKKLGDWLEERVRPLSFIAHYLRPCYFDALFHGICTAVREACCDKMSPFVQDGSNFVHNLAISTVSFCGHSMSADMPVLSPNIKPPLPPVFIDPQSGNSIQACTTISAGLPHFTCGIFRNWGRDTFIALPGCLLIPGRYDEARYIILAYAATLRHGLVPNLLGGGTHARYNCRDAVWWWLNAIGIYVNMAPNGQEILKDTVLRMYPTDDSVAGQNNNEETLSETMQEAIVKHVQGIEFVERNAGHTIDEHMTQPGFNVTAKIDPTTGFVCGGNEHNCGTWMDKMGGSGKAGNKGRPATPRDGAAVELQGLCAAVLQFLHQANQKNIYPYAGVNRDSSLETWLEWRAKLCASFESTFYVSDDVNSLPADVKDASMINRRAIVRDSVNAHPNWADFQLRPNFPIALALAPDLLPPEKAKIALDSADAILRGPLGMKTLDPKDLQYNGYYDNTNDSHNTAVAQGFNYHQGPEWVWVMGYFLRARLINAQILEKTRPGILATTTKQVKQNLSLHWDHIVNSPWRSLPELTNKEGEVCTGSCPAQAWSVACILEVMHQLHTNEQSRA